MSLQLYHAYLSSPARSVRILIKILGLDVEEKALDLMNGEHLKPEFVSINPFHVVPTLVDGDFTLWESRAILTYLVDKYAPDHSVYPKDLKTRAIINRWFYWDTGTLSTAIPAFYGPVRQGNLPELEVFKKFTSTVEDLDKSLEKSKYLAGGDGFTLADLSIALNLKYIRELYRIDLNDFKNVTRWLKQLESDLTPSTWTEFVIEPSQSLGQLLKEKIPFFKD